MSGQKRKIMGVTVGTSISPSRIAHDLKPELKEYVDGKVGDIETALDEILEMQEGLIIPDGDEVSY